MTYGAAAYITDSVFDSTDTLQNSWYTDDVLRNTPGQIAIPALRFYYPDDVNKPAQLYSSITYSVTYDGQTREASLLNSLGSIWQGNIGQETNPAGKFGGRQLGGLLTLADASKGTYTGQTADQRYFTPMGVGTHYITVRVTNAGGNVSVFVGTIVVVGTPWHSVRLIGEQRTTPMRIGETEKMPIAQVTIDHTRFDTDYTGEYTNPDGTKTVTGGHIVTADIHPILGRPAIVGDFYVTGGHRGGAEPGVQFNNFVPRELGAYEFTYHIKITDDYEFYPVGYQFPENHPTRPSYVVQAGDDIPLIIIPALDRTAGPMEIEPITWDIFVNNIRADDMLLDLDTVPYEILADNNPHGILGSYFDVSFDSASDEYVPYYNPRNINVYNYFTPMLTSNAAGTLLEMSDEQLWGGLEPFIPDDVNEGNFVPDQWQYGRILLPNSLAKLASEVDWLTEDFNSVNPATTWITVKKGDATLLNTLPGEDTAENIVYGPGMGEGYAWFRPTGRLVPRYLQGDTEVGSSGVTGANRNVNWAMQNATNKAEWVPVSTPTGGFLRVDGEYTITYHVEYRGVPRPALSFQIAMGDTRAPRIMLIDRTISQDKFTRTYTVGQSFEFDTFDLVVSGTKNDEIFAWDTSKGERNWLANSQRNSNFQIIIMTPTGRQVLLDGDHDYTITVRDGSGEDWSEIHRLYFREPGTYSITFSVKSEAQVPNSREYRITVEEKTPDRPIAPEEVWGTILIIVSIGLFLGVVIYFIRTGQQTKFASAKNKPKRRAKEKEEDADGGVV